MRILFSTLVWLAIFLNTVVMSAFVIASAFLCWPFDAQLRLSQHFATHWAYNCFRLNPRWRLEVWGRERLEQAGPCVIAANHQSQVDIFALSGLHGNWRWVSKSSIFWVPFLGWAMKAQGTPFVRRGDKASGQRVLEQSRRWLEKGVSILIFPEGTRSQDGELQAFKPGAFKLALETGRPVLPVIVEGTKDALPKHSADVSGATSVVISILEPVDVSPWKAAMDVTGLAAHVRAQMLEELSRIRGTVRAGG